MKKIFLFFIKIYQVYISPLSKPTCRFYPTCSEYSKLSIIKFGLIKGLYLTFKRIIKCHPFNKGGVDLVPQNFYFFKQNK